MPSQEPVLSLQGPSVHGAGVPFSHEAQESQPRLASGFFTRPWSTTRSYKGQRLDRADPSSPPAPHTTALQQS